MEMDDDDDDMDQEVNGIISEKPNFPMSPLFQSLQSGTMCSSRWGVARPTLLSYKNITIKDESPSLFSSNLRHKFDSNSGLNSN